MSSLTRAEIATATLIALLSLSSIASAAEVVAYCAQDQVYSQPILRQFEQETGIKVKAVYDSEAVKTVGLANRLLAERRRPRCDVFWGNEEMRTRLLAANDVFRETNGWAAFGYRTRRIVVNTNELALSDAPTHLKQLTEPRWRGKFAMAYPQFGTTATHFQALRFQLGDEAWRSFCKGLAGNQPLLLEGNSSVVKMVGKGEAAVGLTDSDDISAGVRQGMPLAALPLNEDTLFVPNTAGVVRGCPNPAEAQKLFQFLQRPEIVQRLVDAKALDSAGAPATVGLKPDWPKILENIEATTAELKGFFLR